MKIKYNKKIIIIFTLFAFIICIFISSILSLIGNNKKIAEMYLNDDTENSYKDGTLSENVMENEQESSSNENFTLEKVTNTSTYFVLKQCMEIYYNSKKVKSNMGIIDNEAVESLDLNEENVVNLIGTIQTPLFTIDDIYSQKIDSNKRFYVVYHRLETSSSTCKNSVIIIKIDRKNNIFSIYPYEFLEKNNLNNLKENEHINLNKKIENNAVNYYSNLNISDSDITKELFERFKFDLTKDLDKLYNVIDEEYRSNRFENIEGFKNFIQEKNNELSNERIERYSVNQYNNFTEYVGISKNRNYIFIVQDLMNYTIILDNYTIGTPYYLKVYNSSLPHIQARYCIDRVMSAINDKNYKFVYGKMDILKRQSLGSYENFEKYLQNIFYDKTSYEFADYEVIGENVCYDYIVYLDNKEEKQDVKRQIKIRIILKKNADFTVIINE